MALAIRTCIGCRGQFSKKVLLRFVCNVSSDLEIDSMGKVPGRGAYVCLSHSCICAAFKSHKRVNFLLRINLPKEKIDRFKQKLLYSVDQEGHKEGGINDREQ